MARDFEDLGITGFYGLLCGSYTLLVDSFETKRRCGRGSSKEIKRGQHHQVGVSGDVREKPEGIEIWHSWSCAHFRPSLLLRSKFEAHNGATAMTMVTPSWKVIPNQRGTSKNRTTENAASVCNQSQNAERERRHINHVDITILLFYSSCCSSPPSGRCQCLWKRPRRNYPSAHGTSRNDCRYTACQQQQQLQQ